MKKLNLQVNQSTAAVRESQKVSKYVCVCVIYVRMGWFVVSMGFVVSVASEVGAYSSIFFCEVEVVSGLVII